jgi:hypothetical protein
MLELELDISVADVEQWQLIRFIPDEVTRITFKGVPVPYLGIDWGGDIFSAGSEFWRVMRKYYDYDNNSVHVTLMHVAAVGAGSG